MTAPVTPWLQSLKSQRSDSSAGAAPERDGDYAVEAQLQELLIQDIDDSALQGLDPELVRERIEQAARALAAIRFPRLVGDTKEVVVAHVVDEMVGLGPLESLLRDPDVSEVMVNAPDEVYVERDGLLYESDVRFRDEAHVRGIVDRIVASIGRHVDEASPMVDARLRDGSRVNVIIPPLAPRSAVVTIRKFRTDRYQMSDIVAIGTLSEHMAQVLDGCVRAKLNILVSGGTGTGKTTLLNALSASIPSRERVVTIEDPIELKLQQRHVISLEARPASAEGRGEVGQRDLVRNALRMRPDRIIVGEVRGAEAFDMMQAMNTGHEGSLTTVHANTARDALGRIENMVMMAGFEMPINAIREQMASAFDVIIQLSRLSDGSRRIVSLTEVAGMEGPRISLQDVFAYKQQGIGPDGKVIGELAATGIRPQFADRIRTFGIELGADTFDIGRWR